MNIESSLVKMYGIHQTYRHSMPIETDSKVATVGQLKHPRHDDDDDVKLSDAGHAAKTQRVDADPEKTLEAEDYLSIQIFSLMVKRITGQDLQLVTPADLQNQTGGISLQTPQQPPAVQPGPDTVPTYQQSMAYFEAQVATFNAEGTINTKDGQNVKFSVSLSMSQMFYSQATRNQPVANANPDQPLQVSYSGMAAQLTTTAFNFSIDNNGSVDQVTPQNTPLPAANADGKVNQDKDDKRDESLNKVMEKLDDLHESMFDAMKKFLKAMRVWQHHQDGSQQLMALGEQTLGGVFVGHLTKPLPAQTPPATVSNLVANSSSVTPKIDLAA